MKEKTCDCGATMLADEKGNLRCPTCDALDQKRKPGLAPSVKKRRLELADTNRRENITMADRKRLGATVAKFDPLFAIGRGRGQHGADYRYGRGLAKRKAARS